MIAFIHPFALAGPGGGARILRALLDCEHAPAMSINTVISPVASAPETGEIQLPLRPSFGRIECTRFQRTFGVFDGVFRSRFESRLRRVLREHQVKLIHTIPQEYEILPVGHVAAELGIPYFLSIHDDLEYTSRGHPFLRQTVASLGKAWREAKGVFVISEEMGQEYSRRYGAREYRIVTDGLKHVADAPQPGPERSLRLYFMGLFHYSYAQNCRALLDALKIVRSRQPDWDISVTCRCGGINTPVHPEDVSMKVLPFAPEAEVEKDMLSADMLYMPMPFQAHERAFCRFSMSTKMITYLASGLPIFYHGPEDAAACKLLTRHQAAFVCATLDAEEIARCLLDSVSRRESTVSNALALARSQFMLADQQKRFWEPILQAL